MSGRFSYTLTEGVVGRAAMKFGITGVDLDLGVIRQLSSRSTISASVVYGLQGTLLRFKYTRGGTTFDFPVVFSRDFKDWQMAIATYTLPPLIFAAIRYFIWRPLQRRLHRQEVGYVQMKFLSCSLCHYLNAMREIANITIKSSLRIQQCSAVGKIKPWLPCSFCGNQ